MLDLLAFMGRQIIHNHNLSSRQAWRQDLFDILLKSGGIGCPLDDHGLTHPVKVQCGNQRGIFAAITWDAAIGSQAFGCAGVERRQTDVGATLVNHNELTGIKLLELFSPGCSCLFVAF